MKISFSIVRLWFSPKPLHRTLLALVISSTVAAQTSPGGVLTSAACRLWVDAGDINGDGNYTNNPAVNTDISAWNDKSGNANHLTQATASLQPTYNTIAGVSVVRWDNTGTNNDYMTATSQAMLSPGTMYFVLRMLDGGDRANCLWDRNSAGNTSLRYSQWDGLNVLGYTKYGTSDYSTAITSTFGTNVIVSYLKTSASNNVDVAINSSSANLAVGSANPGLPLYVLGKASTTDGMNGYVLEALAYNTNLNYAQKMIIDNYLSAKYNGIAIISDKYAGDLGANGNYDYELGGVGTEASGSNTAAASSITGGLGVVMSTTMEAGEYLMYAHQSTPTNSVNTTDVGGMGAGPSLGRWERIWYLDWTHVGGTNESVDLTFDYSDAGVGGAPGGAVNNYKLLFRAGTSGTWTEVMNATSYSGDQLTFSGLVYNTQGDGYYTIGSRNLSNSALPVEVTAFTAQPCGNAACVRWSTLVEFEADYFIVERSIDGVTWQPVGRVSSRGTGSEYELLDRAVLSGRNYYRLSLVEKDGTTSYSKVVSMVMETPVRALWELYPNPAGNGVTVEFATTPPAGVAFEIINAESGQSLKSIPVTIIDNKATLDLRDYPRGNYLIMVSSPATIPDRKWLILK